MQWADQIINKSRVSSVEGCDDHGELIGEIAERSISERRQGPVEVQLVERWTLQSIWLRLLVDSFFVCVSVLYECACAGFLFTPRRLT